MNNGLIVMWPYGLTLLESLKTPKDAGLVSLSKTLQCFPRFNEINGQVPYFACLRALLLLTVRMGHFFFVYGEYNVLHR